MSFNPKPNRLSPLHNLHQTLNARFDIRGDWQIPVIYTFSGEETAVLRESVGLTDISARGKLLLKGANSSGVITAHFGDTPAKSGHVRVFHSNQILAAELTADEFLVLTPPDAEKELATSLEAEITSQGVFVSVIDLTSGLVGLSISGPKCTAVMGKLCAIPFSSREFPNLCVVQSSFAGVRATIIHRDQGLSPTFELFADCSYGEYLWHAILDAGKEFAIQPVGWEVGQSHLDSMI